MPNNQGQVVVCNYCGTIIYELDGSIAEGLHESDVVEINSKFYCDEDCAHSDGWEQCSECGEWVSDHDHDRVEINDHLFCCEDCAERWGYVRCDRCGDWVLESRSGEVISSGDAETWCDDCRWDHARACYRCGNEFDEEDTHYDEDSDEYYCESCFEHIGSIHLHEYGWTPYLTFYGSGSPFLGVELETDGGDERGQYVNTLQAIEGFPEHFWMTQDGSLQNGVEITSHPMTLAYHMSIAGMYEEIGNAASRYGFGSHDGGRCGLHVNVDAEWFGKTLEAKELAGYKLLRLCQRFERQFMTFSRRTSDRWCHYHTYVDFTPKKKAMPSVHNVDEDESMFAKAKKARGTSCHADCVNLGHIRSRIEIRIFRGTLRWNTYFAALALVNGMCHIVKKRGTDYIEDVDWYTFAHDVLANVDEPKAAEYLREYMQEKELL